MVSPGDVIHIYEQLTGHGVRVWLTGGWGIDALLGEPTRPHKDLDVLMLVDDVTPMCALLALEGYDLKELWSENLWTTDKAGNRIATAFVLRDPAGRELDAHAMRLDEQGNGMPAWEKQAGFVLKTQDLAGIGIVAGVAVRCQSAASRLQARCCAIQATSCQITNGMTSGEYLRSMGSKSLLRLAGNGTAILLVVSCD